MRIGHRIPNRKTCLSKHLLLFRLRKFLARKFCIRDFELKVAIQKGRELYKKIFRNVVKNNCKNKFDMVQSKSNDFSFTDGHRVRIVSVQSACDSVLFCGHAYMLFVLVRHARRIMRDVKRGISMGDYKKKS
jgi:hypothetical protein